MHTPAWMRRRPRARGRKLPRAGRVPASAASIAVGRRGLSRRRLRARAAAMFLPRLAAALWLSLLLAASAVQAAVPRLGPKSLLCLQRHHPFRQMQLAMALFCRVGRRLVPYMPLANPSGPLRVSWELRAYSVRLRHQRRCWTSARTATGSPNPSGDEQRVRSECPHDTNRKSDFSQRITFVVVQTAFHCYKRNAVQLATNQLPRVRW